MRGFNRAYIALTGAWLVWWLVIEPYRAYDQFEIGFTEVHLSMLYDHVFYGESVWEILLGPLILYGVLRLAFRVIGWVVRGFKPEKKRGSNEQDNKAI